MKYAARKCNYSFWRIGMEEDSHGGMCNQFLVSQQCIKREKIPIHNSFTFRDLETFLSWLKFRKVEPQGSFILYICSKENITSSFFFSSEIWGKMRKKRLHIPPWLSSSIPVGLEQDSSLRHFFSIFFINFVLRTERLALTLVGTLLESCCHSQLTGWTSS